MDVKALLKVAKKNEKNFKVHTKMFEIYEGNLCDHLDEYLRETLGPQSFHYASLRKSPINIQRKIVDKLSSIYQQAVSRTAVEGGEKDEVLLEYYEKNMRIDHHMNLANEFFNMGRSTLLQPYAHQGIPRLRAVPNDRFFVHSTDMVDPLNVTEVVLAHSVEEGESGLSKQIFHAYSDEQFIIFDSDGNTRQDLMAQFGNEDGVNPYGVIPFVYVNRSSNLIMPPADKDFLHMTLLIPGLLTDLNFASMFSLFSIMYGINIDDENLELAPNAFWRFKADATTDQKPELGTIKNDADVIQTLELVKSQLAFWLETRSIKAGSMGDVESSNFASGISKLIDESDTTDDKKKQIAYFKQAETDLWNLVKVLNESWIRSGSIDNRLSFSPSAYIETDFIDPVPMIRRGNMVRDLRDEVDAGFLTKRKAIEMLNADKGASWVDEMIIDLEEEKTFRMEMIGGTAESEDTDTQGV